MWVGGELACGFLITLHGSFLFHQHVSRLVCWLREQEASAQRPSYRAQSTFESLIIITALRRAHRAAWTNTLLVWCAGRKRQIKKTQRRVLNFWREISSCACVTESCGDLFFEHSNDIFELKSACMQSAGWANENAIVNQIILTKILSLKIK